MLFGAGKWKRYALLTALAALPVIIIIFSIKNEGETFTFEDVFSNVLDPAKNAIFSTGGFVAKAWNTYFYLSGASTQNITLKRQLDQLKTEQSTLDEMVLENQRLLKLLEYKKNNPGNKLKFAKVTSFSLSPQNDMIVVDSGFADGISKGMAVISVDGLVGRIFKVYKDHSEVLLLTDRNSSIPGIDRSSRARGIVKGRGFFRDRHCELEFVPRSELLKEGDEIISAGMGEFFPKGIIIGKISMVNSVTNTLFQKAEIMPSVRFSNLDEVFIVTKPVLE